MSDRSPLPSFERRAYQLAIVLLVSVLAWREFGHRGMSELAVAARPVKPAGLPPVAVKIGRAERTVLPESAGGPVDHPSGSAWWDVETTGLITPRAADPSKIPVFLFARDRKLSLEALDQAGVSAGMAAALQREFETTWARMAELVVAHVEKDPLRDDPAQGLSAYRIKAFPEAGTRELQDLDARVRQLVGHKSADFVLNSYGWPNEYGAYGQLDVLVQLQEREYAGGVKGIRAKWQAFQPKSGKFIMSSDSDYAGFATRFGDVFKF